jgi:hypothetical protein
MGVLRSGGSVVGGEHATQLAGLVAALAPASDRLAFDDADGGLLDADSREPDSHPRDGRRTTTEERS